MGQVLRGVLVQTNALDPFTFASVVVLLAVVARGCLPGADVACISAGPCGRTPA